MRERPVRQCQSPSVRLDEDSRSEVELIKAVGAFGYSLLFLAAMDLVVVATEDHSLVGFSSPRKGYVQSSGTA